MTEPTHPGTRTPVANPPQAVFTPNLLVVDDEMDARQVLSLMLQARGLNVQQAASARAALPLLQPGLDQVLTDQFMDDGDGWALLAAVRRQLPGVPVLLLSTAAPQRPAQADPALQFDGVLLKPVDEVRLMAMANRLLARPWDAYVEPPASLESPATPGAPASGMAEPADLPEPATEHRQALARLVQAGVVTDILRWADALAQDAPDL
ncbi:MAG: response regulator [Comamonadaceae bacterium]|nr:response regulator [Comamonadaceae bacterium]